MREEVRCSEKMVLWWSRLSHGGPAAAAAAAAAEGAEGGPDRQRLLCTCRGRRRGCVSGADVVCEVGVERG
eukprot:1044091-Pelagomonas_calceolata.AAC.14